MRIALATCEELPEWEVDDRPLHEALHANGVDFDHACWSDRSVEWSAYDACLIRTTWDYAHRRDEFVDWAERAAGLTRLFNPFDTIRWNTCKSYLLDLEQAGIPVIPTHWLEPGDSFDLKTILHENRWKRGFIKPRIGATARATFRFDLDDETLQAADDHLASLLENEAALVQPYLPDVETIGEWSAIFIDGMMTHAVQKIPVAGDYRVQDDFGATDRPYQPDISELELVNGVMNTLISNRQWTGESQRAPLYARIDILKDGTQSMVNEVELVEPSLFFRHGPHAAESLASSLIERVRA
ncbi:MAG: hypothetical protein CMJ40_11195 [Phycisphaerae bacterium]|nr:hypothetical protein [Phycisphaerae bacterium]